MWRLAEDTLDQSDLDALSDWLREGPQLTQGELVSQFESAWSQWNGNQYSVMVTSGSTANLALTTAIAGFGRARPLRIGVAAVTWPTNITPAMMLGHDLHLIDVDRTTLGIDRTIAQELIQNGEIDVLFVTHLLGFTALNEELLRIAEEHRVPVLEDSCEAHGAMLGSKKVGTLGQAGTFSFYFGHHMSTIEGGMISTDDAILADELRLIRNHGLARSVSSFEELAAQYPEIDPLFLFIVSGMNYRSTELNAFLGLRQLATLNDRIKQRNQNLSVFLELIPEWLWSDFSTEGRSSFAIPLIADDEVGAKAVADTVQRLGIESRPVVGGNLSVQPFLASYPHRSTPWGLPVASHIQKYGKYVGNGHHVEPGMVEELCVALKGSR